MPSALRRVAEAASAKPRPWHRGLCHTHPADITHLAITLIKKRLRDSVGEPIDRSYAIVGEPAGWPRESPAEL